MKRKVFETETKAKEFAKTVNGTVRISYLPDYMAVITIYVVEWEGEE